MQTGTQLCSLFATILIHCVPTDPHNLWDQFKDKICDDLAYKISQLYPNDPQPTPELIWDYGLYLLDLQLMKSDRTLARIEGMPVSSLRDWGQAAANCLLHEQLNYNRENLAAMVQTHLKTFNPEQRAVYDAVMDSYNQNLGKSLFIHSAGGGGKTYVCNTIAAAVRSSQHADHRVAFVWHLQE